MSEAGETSLRLFSCRPPDLVDPYNHAQYADTYKNRTELADCCCGFDALELPSFLNEPHMIPPLVGFCVWFLIIVRS